MAMDRYFKYLSSDGARSTLRQRSLRWSRPSRFNDLFDMAVPFSMEFHTEHVTRRALDLMWERLENPIRQPPLNQMGVALDIARPVFLRLGRDQFEKEMRTGVEAALARHPERMAAFSKEIIAHLSTMKVLCLSRVHDDNTMWGLYAENHRGMVLEFANASGVDSPYRLARRVNYCDRAPPLLDDEAMANFLAGNIELTTDLVDPLMILKSTHWRYEQELRLVSGEGRTPNADFEDVNFHSRELVAAYFGARATELRMELEPLMVEKYPHAQLWQASQGYGFQINFTGIDTALR